jgi:sortase B
MGLFPGVLPGASAGVQPERVGFAVKPEVTRQYRTAFAVLRVTHALIDTFVLVVVLTLLFLGCYVLWDRAQLYEQADSRRYEAYRPDTPEGTLSFAALKEQNPDVFGWLVVYGTHINYPLVQSPDNMTYVNTSAEGSYALSGAIFLDSSNSKDLTDFVNIVYGHNMEREKMFGEVGLFAQKSYFDDHAYGSLHFGGKDHGLEFVSFIRADAYDTKVFYTGPATKDDREAYLSLLESLAIQRRELVLGTDDRLVLLSTCSPGPTNRRDVLVARIVDKSLADPFEKEERVPVLPSVDALYGAPGWLVVTGVVVIVAGVVCVIVWFVRKAKRRQAQARAECDGRGV